MMKRQGYNDLYIVRERNWVKWQVKIKLIQFKLISILYY